MRVRVVSPSYIFAHEIETIFTALYGTPTLHDLLLITPSLRRKLHTSSPLLTVIAIINIIGVGTGRGGARGILFCTFSAKLDQTIRNIAS